MDEGHLKIRGNYGTEAEGMLRHLNAACVTLIVLGGNKGHGFSVAGVHDRSTPDNVVNKLPEILRHMADQIEADVKQRKLQ